MKKYKDSKKNIWIDLDNSPHVPFFRPIITEIEKRGCKVTITSRDCFETIKLLKLYDIPHKRISKHFGKNFIMKGIGVILRSLQLYFYTRDKGFDLAINHGSRSQILAAALLKIPIVHLFDYEHGKGFMDFYTKKFIVPESLELSKFLKKKDSCRKVYKFKGTKEDVYINEFKPNFNNLKSLSLDESKIIIVLRPPASQAHYHNPKSDKIYISLLKRLACEKSVQTILLPRTEEQKKIALSVFRKGDGKLTIPEQVVSGLDLLWISDLVISGGGTMTREGVGLGVPAYSIFCGKIGGVDKYLVKQSRLTLIQGEQDIPKIELTKRDKSLSHIRRNNIVIKITDEILSVVE